MDKQQKYIRLNIVGGAHFNIIIPANPQWKLSQLSNHIIKIYNQIAQSQSNTSRAIRVRSITRNGFYVASSHRVGAIFSDGDQLKCLIITKSSNQLNDQPVATIQKKKVNQPTTTKLTQNKNDNVKKPQKLVEQKKQQKKDIKEKKKPDNEKQQKPKQKQQKPKQASTISNDQLLNMIQLVRNSKKEQKPTNQKKQKVQQDDKKTIKTGLKSRTIKIKDYSQSD